jgi:TPR repeat protein
VLVKKSFSVSARKFEWNDEQVKYYVNNGCGEGQNSLGYCYQYGQGVDKDYKKAFEWYSKSANNNECGGGQNSLGYCYQYGQGVSAYRRIVIVKNQLKEAQNIRFHVIKSSA